MKKVLCSISTALLIPVFTWAQVQTVLPVSTAKNGVLTATAYDWEAIGVNPANLGWDINHNLSFTILDIGASGQGNGMSFGGLMQALNSPSIITRADNWQRIMGTGSGLNVNADINWFAVSFRIPKFPGTIALNVRDRVMANGLLGPNSASAISHSNDRIYNDSTILSLLTGTSLNYLHYREFNLSYGSPILNIQSSEFSTGNDPDIAKCFSFTKGASRKTDPEKLALYGGVGIKYLLGLAYISSTVNNGINATYAMTSHYPNIGPGFPNSPGHGIAFDLGLGAKYKKWTFSWSVTDLGSITWHTSETTADTNVATIRHGSDLINQIKNGSLAGSEAGPNVTTTLPAKMRMGASYKVNSKLLVSSDFIMPIYKVANNLSGPYFVIGGQAYVYRRVQLFAGIATASGYGVGVPMGLSISATRNIEFYLGTTDVAAFMGKSANANVSAAIWMFRFNI